MFHRESKQVSPWYSDGSYFQETYNHRISSNNRPGAFLKFRPKGGALIGRRARNRRGCLIIIIIIIIIIVIIIIIISFI